MEFNFKKKFGQNFLTDKNLLDSIVSLSGADDNSLVLEIGPGAGALTQAIAKKAKRVISFEIDKELEPVLAENLKDYDNATIVFRDFMKLSDDEIQKFVGNDYMVIANLPYYITSPILFKLFESKNPPKSLTIMVQKEYGERMVAKPSTSEYSSLSVLCDYLGEAKIVKNVSRKMFTPAPKVDSCIVNFVFNGKSYDEELAKFIKCCFAMRRKTLLNNLAQGLNLSKDVIVKVLNDNQINEQVRAETLSFDEINKLYQSMKNQNIL